MAAPTIEDSATSLDDSNAANPTIDYPATVTEGNTMLAFVGSDGNVAVTWPAGWTELGEISNGTDNTVYVAWRKAGASDSGGSATLTLSGEKSYHYCVSVAGAADPDVTPPTLTSATGNDTSPDPPNITFSSGDYLVFAAFGADDVGTAYPSTYTNTGTGRAGTSGTGPGALAWASKPVTSATSEDPGTFTSVSQPWTAVTVAVASSGGGGGPTPPYTSITVTG